jgi:Ala-tRNA(Pro) deacylase
LHLPAPEAREALLNARLAALGIPFTTHVHAPVFTVEEAQALRGALPGLHAKNLFLEDRKGGLWLVVARENLAVDLNGLARQLGAPRFSFGKPARLAEILGVAPGAVTPFAAMNAPPRAIRVVLDDGLLAGNPVNFHPLRNDRTTTVAAADLVRFLESCGHSPMVLALPVRD